MTRDPLEKRVDAAFGHQSPALQRPDPGRVSPTTNAYVNNGAPCDQNPNGPGCYLDHATRAERLIPGYVDRVRAVEHNFRDALLQCRMEKLIEHEDSDIPWIVSMLIGMVGAAFSYQFNEMLKALRSNPQALDYFGPPQWISPSAARAAANASNPMSLEGLVKGSLDTTRAYVMPVVAGQQASADHQRKAESVSYMDRIADGSAVAFQRLREGVPGIADDGTLLALYATFDPANFPIASFKDQITRQVERYARSHVVDIGRKRRTSTTRQDYNRTRHLDQDADDTFETRVAWVIYFGKTKLAYVDQRVGGTILRKGTPYTTYPMLGLSQDGDDGHASDVQLDAAGVYDVKEEQDQFLEFVEDEFIDPAIARHNSTWASAPKTYYYALGDLGKPVLLPAKAKSSVAAGGAAR